MNTKTLTKVSVRVLGLALVGAIGIGAVLGPQTATAVTAHPVASVHPTFHGGALIPKTVVKPHAPVAPATTGNGIAAAAPPSSIDLRTGREVVGDQGQHSSCVGWAIGYALMGWESEHAGLGYTQFAPYYVYSQINGGRDAGSYANEALDVLKDHGDDTWTDYWQQAADDPITQPTPAEHANAAHWKLTSASPLFAGAVAGSTGAAQIRAALAQGNPVPIGMYVRDGLEQNWDKASLAAATDTDVQNPRKPTGHEILAVGYDSTGLIIQNSWGTRWGAAGFGRLAWPVVETDVYSAYQVGGFVHTGDSSDTTKPTVAAPASAVTAASTVDTAGRVTYTTSFSASDASGIAQTQLDYQVDGGTWTQFPLASATTTNVNLLLTPGHTFRFATNARDGAGNWGDWSYGRTFGVSRYSDASSTVRYAGTWSKPTWSPAVNGSMHSSKQKGASATFTFNGRSAALIAAKAASRGKYYVYMDGTYKGTFDLYSATTKARAIALRASWTTSGTHTLKIVDAGTSGRPTVDIDGFVATS